LSNREGITVYRVAAFRQIKKEQFTRFLSIRFIYMSGFGKLTGPVNPVPEEQDYP
jgi:hypothetical protein